MRVARKKKCRGTMDFPGLKLREKGIPHTATTGIKKLREIARHPKETMLKGVLVNFGIWIAICSILLYFSKLDWITASLSLVVLACYFYYYCLEEIGIASVGIPLFLKSRNKPWTYVFGEGVHWRPYPLCGVDVVSIKEDLLELPEFSINAANSNKTPRTKSEGNAPENQQTEQTVSLSADKKDIVRLRVVVSIRYSIWNPWRWRSIESVKETLGKIIKDSMIEAAQDHDDTALMRDKNLLIAPAQKAADKASDEIGIWVKKILITRIEPWNQKILLAHEQIGIETLNKMSDTIRTKNDIAQVETYKKDLEIPVAEAIKFHANTRGNMPRSEVIVTSSDPLIGAAAVLGQTLNKSGTEKKAEPKKEESE